MMWKPNCVFTSGEISPGLSAATRLLELRHHRALRKHAEVAAALRAARLLPVLLRHLREVRRRHLRANAFGHLANRVALRAAWRPAAPRKRMWRAASTLALR